MATNESTPPKKRHLPILNQPSVGEGHLGTAAEPEASGAVEKAEDRPVWRRVSYGVVATFLVWLPLSVLVETAMRGGEGQERGGSLALVALHGTAFLVGALAGGAVTARFVGAPSSAAPSAAPPTRLAVRQGAIAGGAAAGLAWAIAIAQGAHGGAVVWGVLLLILLVLGGSAGGLGGRLFRKQ